MEQPTHELDQPIWAVVTHDVVLIEGKTHASASAFVVFLEETFGNDITLVTENVVHRMRGTRA